MGAGRRWRIGPAPAVLAVLLGACGGDGGSETSGDALGQPLPSAVQRVFPALAFARITDIRSQPDAAGNDRVFVVEKDGTIRWFDPDAAAPVQQLYLDVSGIPDFSTAGEHGLLGLAFDPGYAVNGYLYVHMVKDSPRRVVIARFHDDGSPPVDPMGEVVVLEADYEMTPAQDNHVAGGIAFGPVDGLLYLTMGDGGGSYDPDDVAQDRSDLRGSILRIDVAGTTAGGAAPNYDIPPANPYAGNVIDRREEIFAYGMRNPWRIAVERTGAAGQRVWVADVGQNAREEVNIVIAGGNYGWDCREGTLVVTGVQPAPSCATTPAATFQPPVLEYGHGLGQSITGGHVYDGARFAGALTGRYVYGDFISGRIWAFDPETGDNDLLADTTLAISTFGVGSDGELYVADYAGGGLYRLAQ